MGTCRPQLHEIKADSIPPIAKKGSQHDVAVQVLRSSCYDVKCPRRFEVQARQHSVNAHRAKGIEPLALMGPYWFRQGLCFLYKHGLVGLSQLKNRLTLLK